MSMSQQKTKRKPKQMGRTKHGSKWGLIEQSVKVGERGGAQEIGEECLGTCWLLPHR